jgi:hypothetical protein
VTLSLLSKVYAALNPHHIAAKSAHGSTLDTGSDAAATGRLAYLEREMCGEDNLQRRVVDALPKGTSILKTWLDCVDGELDVFNWWGWLTLRERLLLRG